MFKILFLFPSGSVFQLNQILSKLLRKIAEFREHRHFRIQFFISFVKLWTRRFGIVEREIETNFV